MPRAKHSTQTVMLILILGVMLGTILSQTFKPLIEYSFNLYHVFALSFFPQKGVHLSEIQTLLFLFTIDATLVCGVIIPLVILIEKKTKLQIT